MDGDGSARCGSLATIGRPVADFAPETSQTFEPVSAGAPIPASSSFRFASRACESVSASRKELDQSGRPCVRTGPEVSPGRIEGACANGSIRITSSVKRRVPATGPSAV